ncbi:GNAT family N-acetyltransferase [Shewanella colwelliana]|uniref:GCN5 family acetyltransferase n=1 Tax=Shewanella colwelliana TaxID=23 RepID=A0A1E5IXC0_SHECO|nr:GNAT family N-acetyltransferase [Shewanella colwelliana]MCZ4338527.1 GNAT family N-acetyltransferase [Shewanella colwelliana]MDX1281693.1 GNAT family N-acetyltransferase [Shewanella colwelliana]OEG75124.1 GCN5 family acetyltransferase [Shewanella colwelliana]GIU37527.1 N-acetyltransferase GCN5 [Shewanella colwelliana]
MHTAAPEATKEQYKAVYLTAEDLRVAASILYNAYHDDPFFIAALNKGDIAQYEQKLRGAIREELNTLWQQEQALIGLFDDQRLIGLACIVTQQVPLGEARYWHWRLKMLLSTGWQSTQTLMKKEASILEHLPSSHCGILQFIALTPIEQNKGLGSHLVKAVMSWCDEQPALDGIGVYVTQESHGHLFSKMGFAAIDKLDIGDVEGELLFYRSEESEQNL